MLISFIITFRETLEAALIVGIVLSYLIKVDSKQYFKYVFYGIIGGIAFSIAGAYIFNHFLGGFEGKSEEVFEGITMLAGAFLITTLIIWMMKQRNIALNIEKKVSAQITNSQRFGLFFLVFISILREGIETIIFLGTASISSGENNILGALVGILAAILIGVLLFHGALRIKIKTFFTVTNILLILFAAGLVAHGVHELQEARIIPTLVEHVWDINPALNPDGGFPSFHEKGLIGNFLKGLFGYNGNPSIIEVLSYVLYWILTLVLWKNFKKEN